MYLTAVFRLSDELLQREFVYEDDSLTPTHLCHRSLDYCRTQLAVAALLSARNR